MRGQTDSAISNYRSRSLSSAIVTRQGVETPCCRMNEAIYCRKTAPSLYLRTHHTRHLRTPHNRHLRTHHTRHLRTPHNRHLRAPTLSPSREAREDPTVPTLSPPHKLRRSIVTPLSPCTTSIVILHDLHRHPARSPSSSCTISVVILHEVAGSRVTKSIKLSLP